MSDPAVETETTAVAPEQPKAPEKPAGEPEWLPKRLEQAKSSAQSELLKGLGVDSPETLKAQLEELAKLKESQLTEAERVAKKIADLEPRALRTAQLEETLGAYAAREMSALTEAQAEAVKGIAGEDASLVLRTIERLKPTWAAKAPETVAPPTTTTAQKSGPPDTGHKSTIDPAAEYKRLKSSNPFEAARFLQAHAAEINASQS